MFFRVCESRWLCFENVYATWVRLENWHLLLLAWFLHFTLVLSKKNVFIIDENGEEHNKTAIKACFCSVLFICTARRLDERTANDFSMPHHLLPNIFKFPRTELHMQTSLRSKKYIVLVRAGRVWVSDSCAFFKLTHEYMIQKSTFSFTEHEIICLLSLDYSRQARPHLERKFWRVLNKGGGGVRSFPKWPLTPWEWWGKQEASFCRDISDCEILFYSIWNKSVSSSRKCR